MNIDKEASRDPGGLRVGLLMYSIIQRIGNDALYKFRLHQAYITLLLLLFILSNIIRSD